MSLYGKIKRIPNNTFQFDRIYHSRREMEENASTDGVYAGRYVLINYGQDVFKNNEYIAVEDNDVYNSWQKYYKKDIQYRYTELGTITEETFNEFKDVLYTTNDKIVYNKVQGEYDSTKVYYQQYELIEYKIVNDITGENFQKQYDLITPQITEEEFNEEKIKESPDIYIKNNNVYTQITSSDTFNDIIEYYKKVKLYRTSYYVGQRYIDTPSGGNITGENNNEINISSNNIVGDQINPLYKRNKDLDLITFGNTYDSTVWQKIYAGTQGEKYIMIAELNALAPQIELANIAPLKYHTSEGVEHPEKPDVYIIKYVLSDNYILIPQLTEQEFNNAKNKVPINIYIKNNDEYVQINNASVFDNNIEYYQKEVIKKPVQVSDICEDYIQPYFDITKSNELSYTLNLPTPLELKVDEGFNYNEEGFDLAYSLPLDAQDKENFICWAPDGLNVTENTNGDIIPDGDSSVSSKTLHFNIPSFGNVMKDLYDLLYGQPVKNDPTNIRAYFKEAHDNYDGGTYQHDTYIDKDRPWLSAVPNIGELLANNTEGLAGILAHLFTKRDPLSGTVKYYLQTSWTEFFDPESSKSFIEDKPNIIGYHYLDKPYEVENSINYIRINPMTQEIFDLEKNEFSPNLYKKSNNEYIQITTNDEFNSNIEYYYKDFTYTVINTNNNENFEVEKISDCHYIIDYDSWSIETPNRIQGKVDLIEINDSESRYKNQTIEKVNIQQNGDIITITTTNLERYSRNPNDISDEGKWIGLSINTSLLSIIGLSLNDNILTSTDEDEAVNTFNLQPGYILYWINVETAPLTWKIKLTKKYYDSKVLTFQLNNIEDI